MSDARPVLRLTPFRATTYAPGIDLSAVICPPYDVIGAGALEEFEAADPHNIVRLTLPRPGAAAGDPYTFAAGELRRWHEAGVLRRDDSPALYVYEHRTHGATAIGLVGGVGLDGPILPHENTFPAPVADRAALMTATRSQFEPILLTYDGDGAASDVVDAAAAGPPDVQVSAGPDVHSIWRVNAPDALGAVAGDLAGRAALIADGHHRFAAYRSVHAAHPHAPATGYGLALLVDAARHPLELRGIHRSIAGLGFDDAVARASTCFEVVPLPDPADAPRVLTAQPETAFVVGVGARTALLRSADPVALDAAIPAGRPDGWRGLDSAVLVDLVLNHLWGVDDADGRVAYHHDDGDALRAASRTDGVAALVRPPALTDVLGLARRGARMPRKSTSFGPKPWTGLLMRELASDGR